MVSQPSQRPSLADQLSMARKKVEAGVRQTVNDLAPRAANLLAGLGRFGLDAEAMAKLAGAPRKPQAKPPGAPVLRGPLPADPPPLRVTPLNGGGDILVKGGVQKDKLSAEILSTYPSIVSAWRGAKAPTPVITSANDGRHRQDSRHYSNQAIDLRANNIDAETAQAIRDSLKAQLGPDYDILYEVFSDAPANNHIHLEYDPR